MIAAELLPPLPRAEGTALDALVAAYAPDYAIDTATDDDRPGRPFRREDGIPDVDASSPVVYTRLAWTRFDGALLPQLVYTVWFAQRPPRFTGDPLAGRLDGLVWRVTLDRDGAPPVPANARVETSPMGLEEIFVTWTRHLDRRVRP